MQHARSEAELTDSLPLPTSSTSLFTVADSGRSSNRLRFLEQVLVSSMHGAPLETATAQGGRFPALAPSSTHGRLASGNTACGYLTILVDMGRIHFFTLAACIRPQRFWQPGPPCLAF